MIIETAILGGCLLAVLWYLKIFVRPKAFPPGPIPLPIIGNIHLLGNEPHKACKKLSRQYGDVFSLYFGGYKVVVVCNIDAAKESLIHKSRELVSLHTQGSEIKLSMLQSGAAINVAANITSPFNIGSFSFIEDKLKTKF